MPNKTSEQMAFSHCSSLRRGLRAVDVFPAVYEQITHSVMQCHFWIPQSSAGEIVGYPIRQFGPYQRGAANSSPRRLLVRCGAAVWSIDDSAVVDGFSYRMAAPVAPHWIFTHSFSSAAVSPSGLERLTSVFDKLSTAGVPWVRSENSEHLAALGARI